MRVLFSMRHLGSFRMYESVLRRLVDAGHEVHVVASHRESLGDGGVPDALLPDVPGIRWSWDEVRPNAWLELATAVRIWTDYLRYFEPAYANAPRLRERAAERVPVLLRRITEWRIVRTGMGRHALAAAWGSAQPEEIEALSGIIVGSATLGSDLMRARMILQGKSNAIPI